MNVCLTLVALSLVVHCYYTVDAKAKWPSNIQRCNRYDPEFLNCLRSAAQKTLPLLAKGLPSLGLGKLDPLEKIDFTISNDRWPVILRVDMTNTGIAGPSNMDIRDISFDRKTSLLKVDGFHKKLIMYGNYKARGNVLAFPLNNQGTFNFVLRNVHASHSLKLLNNTRDKDHGNVGFTVRALDRITMDLFDPHFSNGANRALNRLVNDNWQIISQALTPSMERVIGKIFKKAFKPLFSRFSTNEIFPLDDIKESDYEEKWNATGEDKLVQVFHLIPVYPLILPLEK